MKRRPRSIQYLLSVDRRLRRLSLKKIPRRAKSASRVHRPVPLPKPEPPKAAEPSPYAKLSIVATFIGIVAAAGLMAARPASRPADVALASFSPAANTEAESVASQAAPAPKIARTPSSKLASAAPYTTTLETTVVGKMPAPADTKQPEHAVPAAAKKSNAPAKELAATPLGATATSGVKTPIEPAGSVTVTGCLEPSGPGFRLTDTSGDDAPKARSWKSGFLRKHSASIELVDSADTLGLPGHVGQRVSATGVLANREMRAHSLQSLSASCR